MEYNPGHDEAISTASTPSDCPAALSTCAPFGGDHGELGSPRVLSPPPSLQGDCINMGGYCLPGDARVFDQAGGGATKGAGPPLGLAFKANMANLNTSLVPQLEENLFQLASLVRHIVCHLRRVVAIWVYGWRDYRGDICAMRVTGFQKINNFVD